MSLADDLLAPPEQGPHRGTTCSVRALHDQLAADGDPDAAAALLEIVDNVRDWSGMAVERRLKALGLRLTAAAVQRHRRAECKCP